MGDTTRNTSDFVGVRCIACLGVNDAPMDHCRCQKENVVSTSAKDCEVVKIRKQKKKERRKERVCAREREVSAAAAVLLEQERNKASMAVSVRTVVEADDVAGIKAEAEQAGAKMEATKEAGTAASIKADKDKRRRAARRAKEKQRKLDANCPVP